MAESPGMNTGIMKVGLAEAPVEFPFKKATSGALEDSEIVIEIFTGDRMPPKKTVKLMLEANDDSASNLPWIQVDNGNPPDILFERVRLL